MSLGTRLSWFFLVALAVVLAGFSVTLYLLARNYLVGQLDERLQHALETLEASVDIEPGGLEWEPADRQLSLGMDHGSGGVRWAVRDGRGILVDYSSNVGTKPFPTDWLPTAWPSSPADATVFGDVRDWRLAARRLQLDDLLSQGRGHPNDEPGYEKQYPVLVLVAGLSPAPMRTALRRLALTLSLLSFGVWTVSVAVGRWLSRRALEPLTRMAKTATAMTVVDLERRLPITGVGDELDELGGAFNDLLDRLKVAFDRLHAAYDGQRRFAGDASHQLRTPLAALLGQVEVALRRDRAPEDYRRVLQRVHDEGDRLRQIVESLLVLAQAEGLRAEPEVLNLADWVSGHLRSWDVHPRAADLTTEVASNGPFNARVHPPLLAQLVDNLIENAFKYSEPGTPVVIRTWREDGSVMLGVKDSGCGLEAADLAHVFEPFYRGDRAQRNGHAGVGLGLAVAQQIAGAFGGSLEVQSEPQQGCCFVLRLPES